MQKLQTKDITDTNKLQIGSKLPIVRYNFEFEVTSPLALPEYAGSVLRGVFGHSLKKLRVASNIAKIMQPRDLYNLCPYTMLFEPSIIADETEYNMSDIPVPYVIEPSLDMQRNYNIGDKLEFSIVLIGNAIEKLPFVINAMQHAFKRGVGTKIENKRGTAKLTQVTNQITSELVYTPEEDGLLPHQKILEIQNFDVANGINFEIITPLRLQEKGRILFDRDKITARHILIAMTRRCGYLFNVHTTTPPKIDYSYLYDVAKNLQIELEIRHSKWTRYSNRQKQKMHLPGIKGRVKITGDKLEEFIPIVYLSQYLHFGKNTSFGLGRIRILGY